VADHTTKYSRTIVSELHENSFGILRALAVRVFVLKASTVSELRGL
jgi:hypothetical protein